MKKLSRSFVFAWQGIKYCFSTQPNFRIHLAVLVLVVIAGAVCAIDRSDWLSIVVCAMVVLILEMINTALEYLCDTITTDYHPTIKIIKDVAAGAVLIAAIASVIVGALIFLPKIIHS